VDAGPYRDMGAFEYSPGTSPRPRSDALSGRIGRRALGLAGYRALGAALRPCGRLRGAALIVSPAERDIRWAQLPAAC
jgi:hypothetical protein